MEETYQLTSALKHLAFGKHVALLTDARFSGVSTGACIGHVGPEALAGGPIGKLRDGDLIAIVIDRVDLDGTVDLDRRDGERFDAGARRRGAGRARRSTPTSRPIPRSPTTPACGRPAALSAAPGAAASTTSTRSSARCAARRRRRRLTSPPRHHIVTAASPRGERHLADAGGMDGMIALIAHDGTKDEMVALAEEFKDQLEDATVVATATTGGVLRHELELDVRCVLSGPLGGDLQIGSMVAGGFVKLVIFLRDPLTAHAHDPDIQALLKVCDVQRVPLRDQRRDRRGSASPRWRPVL